VYGEGSTAERIGADLAADRLDAAILWGPQAGWFARRDAARLALTTLRPPEGLDLPFDFAISVGVRKSMPALRDEIDSALQRRAPEVRLLLDAYGVPQLELGAIARSPGGGGR
jgi:mxaJ protein